MDRGEIESRWLALTRETLPAMAAERNWPVSADHCFQRILLDHVCDGVWYDHIAGRPAYRHLSADQLVLAVETAEAVAAGTADLHRLNQASLRWRSDRKIAQRRLGRGEQDDRRGGDGQEEASEGRGKTGHG